MKKVIVVVGPTASGKSALGVRLAKRFNGEIISADSRQVYKGLNIGTGKISKKEMRGVKHYLLDIASPKKIFTASDFLEIGRKKYSHILKRGKLPVIVGGTGFYIDVLLGRIKLANAPPNALLRKRLQKKSAAELFALLEKTDPARAKSLNHSDKHNPVRLIRALEIAAQQSHISTATNETIPAIWLGILPSEKELRNRIHRRLIARMRNGMSQEAKRLHARGLSWKRMEDLGLEYRYLARYLRGHIGKNEMLIQLENEICRYAKRQKTYWRRNKNIKWFSPYEISKVEAHVRHLLSR